MQNSFSRSALRYGAGYVAFTFGRMLQAILVARILGPALFGVWAALSLYRQYGQFSDAGTSKGIGRLLPELLHSRHENRANVMLGIGWGTGIFTTITVTVFVTIYLCATQDVQAPYFAAGATTLVLLLFLDKQYAYLSAVLQGSGRVDEAGIWMGVLGTCELLLGATLTWCFGLPGFYCSLVLSILLVVCGMMWCGTPRPVLRFNRKLFATLVSSSLLLTGFGLLNIALHNIDRIAIISVMGVGERLSHYHVASMFAMMVTQVPGILMGVLAPRIYRFGASDIEDLRRYTLLPTVLIAFSGVAVAVFVSVSLPFVFECLLPDYSGALPIARLLIWGEFFFAVTMVGESINVAVGRGHISLAIRWATVGICLVAGLFVLSRGGGLLSLAGIVVTAHLAGWLAVSIVVSKSLNLSLVRYIAAVLGPLLYGVALLSVSSVAGVVDGHLRVLPSLIICCIGFFPVAITALAYARIGVCENTRIGRLVLDWWRNNVNRSLNQFGGFSSASFD